MRQDTTPEVKEPVSAGNDCFFCGKHPAPLAYSVPDRKQPIHLCRICAAWAEAQR